MQMVSTSPVCLCLQAKLSLSFYLYTEKYWPKIEEFYANKNATLAFQTFLVTTCQ